MRAVRWSPRAGGERAITDVSIDIASGLYEVHGKVGTTGWELFRSGMNIGRDIMGTIANPLLVDD